MTTHQHRLISTLLLLIVYVVNYLSSSGTLGEGMMHLRDIFPFSYMPAGWTFGVARGLIYLALGVWICWSWSKAGKKNTTNTALMPRFQISCILNIVWIVATAHEYYLLSTIVIALLMVVLLKMLDIIHQHTTSPYLRLPFGLYTGRIIMATMIIAVSQFIYLALDKDLPLSNMWTSGILVRGVFWAGWRFFKYRNRGQLAITLIALAGIANSMNFF